MRQRVVRSLIVSWLLLSVGCTSLVSPGYAHESRNPHWTSDGPATTLRRRYCVGRRVIYRCISGPRTPSRTLSACSVTSRPHERAARQL